MGEWKDIQNKLIETINIIFYNYDINNLSFYERRKIIFEHLTEALTYDFDLLDQIKSFAVNKNRITRNPIKELESVINNKKGICNAISQYYKLLLEQVGIKAYCVICDDGTEVNHQLNLIYDEENDIYSFDDVTSVIVEKGTKEECFDYDLEFANSIKQGTKDIVDEQKFVVLPEDYINYLINRKVSLSETLNFLPDNIASLKRKLKIK